MNIFLLCSSPVRANGHLCLGVAIAIGSADGGTVATGASVDGGMAIDPDARCGAARMVTERAAAANGRAITGSCRHIGMPPDDDVFCISTLAPARKTTAADAGTALASERIDRCIALNNDILCIFSPDSTDGCAAIKFFGFGGQAAGAVFFCRSYFFSLVIRLIRNGQPTIPIILVQLLALLVSLDVLIYIFLLLYQYFHRNYLDFFHIM